MLFSLLGQQPIVALAFLVSLVLAISVHEFSHALAGYLLGDRTAQYQGRLTLNPLAHLDFMGSLMLLFVGFGWGKPVPYNPYNLKYQRFGTILTALAGPFSNLFLFLFAGGVFRLIFPFLSGQNGLIIFLTTFGMLNLGLMFFNLIPIPPLDGSRLLDVLLPQRFEGLKEWIFRHGPNLLFALILMDIVLGISVFRWLSFITNKIFFWIF